MGGCGEGAGRSRLRWEGAGRSRLRWEGAGRSRLRWEGGRGPEGWGKEDVIWVGLACFLAWRLRESVTASDAVQPLTGSLKPVSYRQYSL